jgi:hypothetical protein
MNDSKKTSSKNSKAKRTNGNGTRTGLPKLRAQALKALGVDAFSVEVLRAIITSKALPKAA